MPALSFLISVIRCYEQETYSVNSKKGLHFFKLIYGFKVKPWEIHPFERETSDIIVSAIQ